MGDGNRGFEVARSGDGRVSLIGFPSVGKSSLLSKLTDTKSEAAGYEFTTLTAIPGNLYHKGCKIQLLDLPGIIEGAAYGKGRGRQVRRRTTQPCCGGCVCGGCRVRGVSLCRTRCVVLAVCVAVTPVLALALCQPLAISLSPFPSAYPHLSSSTRSSPVQRRVT